MKKQKNLAWLVSLILATSLLLTACPDPINTGTDAETESSEQVEAGLAALAEDDLDGALDSFKLALVANPDNVDAQVYVSFLEIAALSTDTDMIDLMSNRIGVQNYPSTLNDVVGLSWISEYTYNGTRWVDHDFDPETPLIEESYTEIYNFPALQMPDEVISFFPEGALTGEWFPEIYMINLAANILTRNPTGFNTVVDNIKALSLGSNLNTIISMIEELDSDTRVEIPANLYSDMLTAMYGENPVPASLTLTVGKPELMILAAYLQTCQALVQYVASVDFSYDIDGVIEALLASNLMVVADEAAALQSIFDATPGFFFTDLLTTRSEADRTASKASLLAAMTTAIGAYNLYKEQLLDSSSWYRTSMQTMAIEFGETAPSTAEIQDMIDTMYQPMIDEAELVKTAIQNNTSYDYMYTDYDAPPVSNPATGLEEYPEVTMTINPGTLWTVNALDPRFWLTSDVDGFTYHIETETVDMVDEYYLQLNVASVQLFYPDFTMENNIIPQSLPQNLTVWLNKPAN